MVRSLTVGEAGDSGMSGNSSSSTGDDGAPSADGLNIGLGLAIFNGKFGRLDKIVGGEGGLGMVLGVSTNGVTGPEDGRLGVDVLNFSPLVGALVVVVVVW